jgi:hypothetical protein
MGVLYDLSLPALMVFSVGAQALSLRWHLDRNIHPTGTDPMDAEWFG